MLLRHDPVSHAQHPVIAVEVRSGMSEELKAPPRRQAEHRGAPFADPRIPGEGLTPQSCLLLGVVSAVGHPVVLGERQRLAVVLVDLAFRTQRGPVGPVATCALVP